MLRTRAPPAGGDLSVAPVALEKLRHSAVGGLQALDREAVVLEAAEGLRHVVEEPRVERRQGFAQRCGQLSLVELARQLGLPQLDQEVDQGVVALDAEVEKPPIDGGAIALGGSEDLAALPHPRASASRALLRV